MGHFTDYYPTGARIVAYRYNDSVTVPGKGGRPRKWLSDADRVRAYRARQSGDSEPPTVFAARSGDDALAAALQREHDLEHLLTASRQEVAELRRNLTATATSIDTLQSHIADLERERAFLSHRVAELDDRSHRHEADQPDAIQGQRQQLPNRASRRRAQRKR